MTIYQRKRKELLVTLADNDVTEIAWLSQQSKARCTLLRSILDGSDLYGSGMRALSAS
jgi:hypothetical protein